MDSPHPQPAAPADLAAASSAQHAGSVAGAGPPQHASVTVALAVASAGNGLKAALPRESPPGFWARTKALMMAPSSASTTSAWLACPACLAKSSTSVREYTRVGSTCAEVNPAVSSLLT